MAPHFRINRNSEYLPFSFADEVGLTTDKLIALNNTVTMLPLELDVSPSSLGTFKMPMLRFSYCVTILVVIFRYLYYF